MPRATLSPVLRHVRRLAASAAGEGTDRQLLERFSRRREEDAFAVLVKRHGPLVLGVCRRVLRHEQDAEDAFQATFLVLARKAASIGRRQALASWLHGVAYRIALRVRAMNARRQAREKLMAVLPDVAAGEH